MWNKRTIAGWLFMGGLFAACNGGQPKEEKAEDTAREVKQELFHQQESLQAGDSLHIRLLSWGGEEIGNYLLLLADSAQQRYIGRSFFRKGRIKNSWVHDLDKDQLPEISIVLQEQTGDKYGRLLIHELGETFNFTTITLPQLSESIAATYGGHDSIYLQNGQFFHEFRIRNRADPLAGEEVRQRVVYTLENNTLQVVETGKK